MTKEKTDTDALAREKAKKPVAEGAEELSEGELDEVSGGIIVINGMQGVVAPTHLNAITSPINAEGVVAPIDLEASLLAKK